MREDGLALPRPSTSLGWVSIPLAESQVRRRKAGCSTFDPIGPRVTAGVLYAGEAGAVGVEVGEAHDEGGGAAGEFAVVAIVGGRAGATAFLDGGFVAGGVVELAEDDGEGFEDVVKAVDADEA